MLQLEQVQAGYQGRPVVHDIDFALPAGTIGCLLGPSGCGKTTLLRVIAGFEPVQAGRVRVAGSVVSEPGRSLAPERRGVGVVFQDLALFPHLDVAANIGFGLTGLDRTARAARVNELLQLVGLADSGPRYPHQLSGGQQQRVSLARALAPRPRLLLLDEPFSSLDLELRESLALDVRAILRRESITALLVTHDQHEAFALADHIAVLRAGRIEQQADADQLYRAPATPFVAGFIGQGRLLAGTVTDGGQVDTALGRIASTMGSPLAAGSAATVLLRPEDLRIGELGASAVVLARAFRGAQFLYTLRLDDGSEVLAFSTAHHAPGDAVRVAVTLRRMVAFAAT